MAKKKDEVTKSKLKKGKNYFTLIGELKLSENSFPPESESKKSAWISRRMSLGVKIGEGYVVYAEAMGGFMGDKPSPIKVFKKTANKEDSMMEIAWEDRNNLDAKVLDDISPMSFTHAYIEKKENGKLFEQKFLHMYDAIPYFADHLKDGMKVKVRGRLKPNPYDGKLTYKKEITSISLAGDNDIPGATGIITVIVPPDFVDKSRLKEADELDLNVRFVDYAKEYNGHTIKDNIAYPMPLVLPVYSSDPKKSTSSKFTLGKLKADKNKVREVTVEVMFEEGNLTKQATLDDLDDESRMLVEMGVYTEEEAIGKMTVKGNRLNRMILLRPFYEAKDTDDEGGKKLVLTVDDEKYTEADLVLPEPIEQAHAEEVSSQSIDDVINAEIAAMGESSTNWLDDL